MDNYQRKYTIDVTPYGLNITELKPIKFLKKTFPVSHEILFDDLLKVIREEYSARFNSLIFFTDIKKYEIYFLTNVDDLEIIYAKILKYRSIYNITFCIRDITVPRYEFNVDQEDEEKAYRLYEKKLNTKRLY